MYIGWCGDACVVNSIQNALYSLSLHYALSFSLALHSDKTLVATAQIGKEPFVCVWDSSTLETVSILQGGHERGITALAFSRDGNVYHAMYNVYNGIVTSK